jgi:hypothetical protein
MLNGPKDKARVLFALILLVNDFIIIIVILVAFLCDHLSSAEASGVHRSFSHLLTLRGVHPGSIQHPGLPSARQVHEGE